MAPLGLTGLPMEPDVRVFMETEPRVLGRPTCAVWDRLNHPVISCPVKNTKRVSVLR